MMQWLLACLAAATAAAAPGFVRVKNAHFEVNGAPYYFVGTNFWYGMNLGALDAGGDRARLVRELDRLQRLGVRNLRVLGMSEGPDNEPWRIVPAAQPSASVFNLRQLRGLDYLLAEMKKRDMRAVVCLSNFWPWSGGFAQYLAWAGAGAIPYPPPHPGGTWHRYQSFTGKFYANAAAVAAYRTAVRSVVTRRNEYTGALYADDPTIMAWQLANEPRGHGNPALFNQWIGETADFIKSLDKNHLVTTGSEGETPSPANAGLDFLANHSHANIDYATAHVWAQNWGWYDPGDGAPALDAAIARMREYVADHVEKARLLSKPLVVEEFGLARDGGNYDPAAATTARDRYYRAVFEEIYRAARAGAPAAGVNFWAWAGEARPRVPGAAWKTGDPFIGDPPHELQGWYSVYAADVQTHAVVSEYAGKMGALSKRH
jgi:mannan endo-1,4-beta-mannosidase